MHFLFIYLFIPVIHAFVTTQIHRNSIYRSEFPCTFLGNISLLNDPSIQSCIWTCVYEYHCQTAVYFKDIKICSMFADVCEKGSIESSGHISASVICYRKNHVPVITCSSTVIANQDEEKTSDSNMMESTEQILTSISATPISTPSSAITTTAILVTLTTENAYACGNMTILVGYDLFGNDIDIRNLPTYNACCTRCRSYNNCVSFTWGLPTAGGAASVCYSKNATSSASNNSALVSAHY